MSTETTDAKSFARTLRMTSAARNALNALAERPGLLSGATYNAAAEAAATAATAPMVAFHIVARTEPTVIADAMARLLDGAKDTVTQWATRFHYTDGREPNVSDPQDEFLARMSAEGTSAALADRAYRARWSGLGEVDRAEVVTRQVVTLRDGSVFMSPWVPA